MQMDTHYEKHISFHCDSFICDWMDKTISQATIIAVFVSILCKKLTEEGLQIKEIRNTNVSDEFRKMFLYVDIGDITIEIYRYKDNDHILLLFRLKSEIDEYASKLGHAVVRCTDKGPVKIVDFKTTNPAVRGTKIPGTLMYDMNRILNAIHKLENIELSEDVTVEL